MLNKSRWRMDAILKNHEIYCLISATFDWFLWNLAWWRTSAPYSGLTVKIWNFWKSTMAAASVLKITKKVALSQQRFDRSSWNLVWWCKVGLLTTRTVKFFLNFVKVQDAGLLPFWKPLNLHIFATIWLILMKFDVVMHIGQIQWTDR